MFSDYSEKDVLIAASFVYSVLALRSHWIFLHITRKFSIWRPHTKTRQCVNKRKLGEEHILPSPKDWTLLKLADLVSQMTLCSVTRSPSWAYLCLVCNNQLLQMAISVLPLPAVLRRYVVLKATECFLPSAPRLCSSDKTETAIWQWIRDMIQNKTRSRWVSVCHFFIAPFLRTTLSSVKWVKSHKGVLLFTQRVKYFNTGLPLELI